MQQISKQPAFRLGQIVATPGALAALKKAGQQPGEFLTRHVHREWGDLPDDGPFSSVNDECKSSRTGLPAQDG